jgi:hypothetical protein
MAYSRVRGRRPYERASKIAHSEIINDPQVVDFVEACVLPAAPEPGSLTKKLEAIPPSSGRITTVIAIDGGLTETYVREEFPSASIAFVAMGPLLLRLADLYDLDAMPFIGPDDMGRLKNIDRYSFAFPVRGVRYKKAPTFSEGVRLRVHEFLSHRDGHLLEALKWLLCRGWAPPAFRQSWIVPQCPNADCLARDFSFSYDGPVVVQCDACGRPVYLADALRLYERIDEEQGAGAIVSYLLTSLEQIVLVHLIRSVLKLKPALLEQVLFVKDGPLAFFGVTAPLYGPMRDLMKHLAEDYDSPLINLVGLEKSGAFVEHAQAIEDQLIPYTALTLDSEYIYKHIVPGDPMTGAFGANTYYGAKVIFAGGSGDIYVGTVPTGAAVSAPRLKDLYNGADVLRATVLLRCSMYDNALIPVALANKLVSLADMPSAEILKKFVATALV